MSDIKTLYRSRTDRKLTGVCGGLGKFLGIDPTLVRVVYVIASLFMGFFVGGIVLYIVLTAIIPEEP